MSTPDASWVQAGAPLVGASLDVNTGIQTQNISAYNGACNINEGDFTLIADQKRGCHRGTKLRQHQCLTPKSMAKVPRPRLAKMGRARTWKLLLQKFSCVKPLIA